MDIEQLENGFLIRDKSGEELGKIQVNKPEQMNIGLYKNNLLRIWRVDDSGRYQDGRFYWLDLEQNADDQENDAEYAEEELEKLKAGYNAAMRYPEGKVEKIEPPREGVAFPFNYIHWTVSARSNDWMDGEKAEVIDWGDYYEVTNCEIQFPYIVSEETVGQFADGFEFDVSLYDQNNEPDTIHSVVVNKDGDWWLSPDGSTDIEDKCRFLDMDPSGKNIMSWRIHGEYCLGTIYRGSLFFRKDCIVHDCWLTGSKTFEDYATKEAEELYTVEVNGNYQTAGFQGGKSGNTGINLNGEAIFDPKTGLIVEFQEIYIS